MGNVKFVCCYGLEVDKLFSEEFVVKFLFVQMVQFVGKDDEVCQCFEVMLENLVIKVLGLYGLFVEVECQCELVVVCYYVEEVLCMLLGLEWVGKVVFGYQVVVYYWDEVLQILECNYVVKFLDKKVYCW